MYTEPASAATSGNHPSYKSSLSYLERQGIVTPRGGYNKTGRLTQGGERTNWLGKPIGGEYSYKKDLGSGKQGSIHWEFDSALLNIDYTDQYRFRGIRPRTHWVSHRGWLEKNVQQWLPQLAREVASIKA